MSLYLSRCNVDCTLNISVEVQSRKSPRNFVQNSVITTSNKRLHFQRRQCTSFAHLPRFAPRRNVSYTQQRGQEASVFNIEAYVLTPLINGGVRTNPNDLLCPFHIKAALSLKDVSGRKVSDLFNCPNLASNSLMLQSIS